MRSCPLFAAVLSGMGGRSRRSERMLGAMQAQLNRMEATMAKNDSALMAKLEALQAQVDAYTTDQGNRIAAAVAAAKAAQQKDDKAAADAEMADALSKIDEIGKGLVTFSPSAN